MANISDFKGTITLYAENNQILYDFLKVQEKSNQSVYYDTTIVKNYNSFDEFKEKTKTVKNEEHIPDSYKGINLEVYGCGRWSAHSNIDWFFSSIKEVPELKDHPSLNHTIYVLFDIIDHEPGIEFIETTEKLIKWNPNKAEQIELFEVVQDYDYTPQNLEAFDIYDTPYTPKDLLGELDELIVEFRAQTPPKLKAFINRHDFKEKVEEILTDKSYQNLITDSRDSIIDTLFY